LAGGRGATLTDHVVQLSAFDQLQILYVDLDQLAAPLLALD